MRAPWPAAREVALRVALMTVSSLRTRRRPRSGPAAWRARRAARRARPAPGPTGRPARRAAPRCRTGRAYVGHPHRRAQRGEVDRVRRAEDPLERGGVLGRALLQQAEDPPPRSLSTTIVRSGRGSSGPRIRPVVSCSRVRSPSSATVGPACASAAPIAVETVPSIPATPRLDRTTRPSRGAAASATSRTGLDEPSTSWVPSASAATSARASRIPTGPVVERPRPGRPRRPCRRRPSGAATPGRDAAAAGRRPRGPSPRRRSTAGRARRRARTPRRRGRRAVRATARCSVGRPATTTCAGVSDGVPSSHGPVRTAPGHGADDGSAITGTPTSSGGRSRPRDHQCRRASGPAGSGRATTARWPHGRPRPPRPPDGPRRRRERPDARGGVPAAALRAMGGRDGWAAPRTVDALRCRGGR